MAEDKKKNTANYNGGGRARRTPATPDYPAGSDFGVDNYGSRGSAPAPIKRGARRTPITPDYPNGSDFGPDNYGGAPGIRNRDSKRNPRAEALMRAAKGKKD